MGNYPCQSCPIRLYVSCFCFHSANLSLQSGRSVQSPSYGATSTSPIPLGRNPSVPPPLDLGEASVPEDSNMPKLRAEESRIRKGVTFPSTELVGSPTSISSQGGSRHRSSDDGHVTSDSAQPLNPSGPSKSQPIPKIGRSPRFARSPQLPLGSPKTASPMTPSSPQIGRRSLRKRCGPPEADPQAH